MREHELRRNPLSKGEVLMVCTSCNQMSSGDETGLWLSELAVPYCEFKNAGFDVIIATPKGGQVPVDPRSLKYATLEGETVATVVDLFQKDETAHQMMSHSVPLDEIKHVTAYRVVFLAGGHGASFDFPSTPKLQEIVKEALSKGVFVAAVCHGNAVFASEELGKVVSGRRLTAFSDDEERAVGRDADVPFLLESRLRELGANVVTGAAGEPHVVVDGNLLTGQNPASAAKLAHEVVAALASSGPAGPASHPGTFTAEEVQAALGVAAPVHSHMAQKHSGAAAGIGEEEEDVVEPSIFDNLGPNAEPNPGTNAGNEEAASG